jgi:hypothetical protein
MKFAYIITVIVVILIIGITIFYGGSPAGAVVRESSGTVCCTFEHEGQAKTCVAPDGQSCAVCDELCAVRRQP